MSQTTCIIIDDELQARKRLEEILQKFESMNIIASEGVPEQAIEKVCKLKPDIVFVDVEMPRMNGFALIKAIREKKMQPYLHFCNSL